MTGMWREQWQFGRFTFDEVTGILAQGNRETTLLPKDCLVLEVLLTRSGQLVSKEELHRHCWPQQAVVGGDVLKTCIRRLRKTLGDDFHVPEYIETVGRRGYRFLVPAIIREKQSSPSPTAVTVPPDFVGRKRELTGLSELFAKVRAGDFGLLVISGEAGIGKTTLLENFLKAVGSSPDTLLLHGQCLDCNGPAEAYHPLLSGLGQLADVLGKEAIVPLLRAMAPMWLAQLPWLVGDAGHLDLLADLQGASGQRMQREMLALLVEICRRQTVIIVLEDMHWSDTATIDLLGLLARSRPQPQRLLVIATCRINENPSHPFHLLLDDLGVRDLCTHFHLLPLPEQEIDAYLAGRFSDRERPAGLSGWLREFSGGNPLLFRAMVDQGLRKGWLHVNEGIIWQRPDAEDVNKMAPRNLRYLLDSRLHQLSTAEKECLETASVAGMNFSTRLLAESAETEGACEALCEQLVRSTGFLARSPAKNHGYGIKNPGFYFRHALYQRLICESIPLLRRQHLHLTVGERLEAISIDNPDELAVQLALHFEFAGRPLKAAHYRMRVALASLMRHAYREVIDHAERGLSLLEGLPQGMDKAELELGLLLPLGSSYLATRGYASPEVERIYSRAYALSGTSTSSCQMIVLFSLGTYWLVRGDLPRMREVADTLASFPLRTNLDTDYVSAHALASMFHFYRGDFSRSYSDHQLCEKYYNPAMQRQTYLMIGIEPGLTSAGHAALTSWFMGYPERAEREMNRCVELAREHYGPFMQIWCICYMGWLNVCIGNRNKVRECGLLANRLSRENGIEYWIAQSSIQMAWVDGIEGDYESGIRRIKENISAHHQTGAQLVRGCFLSRLADVQNASGRTDDALVTIDEAILVSQRTGEEWWLAEMYRMRGDILVASADRVEGGAEELLTAAEENYRTAIDLAASQQAKTLELRSATNLATLWLRKNKADEGLALLEHLYSWFTEGFSSPDLQATIQLLGDLARRLQENKSKDLS
jgi:DNA-binding winged helix-turn-helix (wHTH) protein